MALELPESSRRGEQVGVRCGLFNLQDERIEVSLSSNRCSIYYVYCISSDFSFLPDMTEEYMDVSVYVLTGLLLYLLYHAYTNVKCMKSE